MEDGDVERDPGCEWDTDPPGPPIAAPPIRDLERPDRALSGLGVIGGPRPSELFLPFPAEVGSPPIPTRLH
jgi:hypothetical protein